MLLCIKGDIKDGKEVISYLEMLGGKNDGNLKGDVRDHYYFIWDDGCINSTTIPSGITFTLREFKNRYPYKIGDKVVDLKTSKTAEVYKLHWSESNHVVYYSIKYLDNTGCIRNTKDLQYLEEKSEFEKGYYSAVEKALKWLKENTDWSFEYDEVGRNFDFGKLEEFKEYMKNNIV